jgi:hypothetical protein
MDALSDVLKVAHLTGGVFLRADFFAPWCMAARVPAEQCQPALGPASHIILYHYVVEGALRVRVGEDGPEVLVVAGEAILLPRNDPHLMGSDLSLRPVAGRDIVHPPKDGGLYSIHHGGNGERTQVVCGFLGCASAKDNPVISTLPPMLKFTVDEGAAGEWIRSTFRYGAEEVSAGRCSPSFLSCCSSRRCGVTRSLCRTARPDGLQVCANPMSVGRWRFCTATRPGAGHSTISAARSACHVRRWPIASFG